MREFLSFIFMAIRFLAQLQSDRFNFFISIVSWHIAKYFRDAMSSNYDAVLSGSHLGNREYCLSLSRLRCNAKIPELIFYKADNLISLDNNWHFNQD